MSDWLSAAFDLDVIRVSGPDAASYLQGQISQDVDTIGSDRISWSFVLQPSGKIESWFRIWRRDESTFVLYVEPGSGLALADRLRHFLIHTDAAIETAESVRMLSIRGVGSSPIDAATAEDGLQVFVVDWPDFRGIDFIGSADVVAALSSTMGVDSSNLSRFESSRILAGIPRFGVDIAVGSIPAEAGDAVVDASVSFTKGCYTGQELVARMRSRGGQAPFRLRQLTADSQLIEGSDVTLGGDVVGVVKSASGHVGLATLMRRVSAGDRVDVQGISAVVAELPGDAVS